MPLHQQVSIEQDGRSAEVDEGLAPLILALWKRGFRTTTSCEAQNGTAVMDSKSGKVVPVAWIAFATLGEAEVFLQIVGEQGQLMTPEPQHAEGLSDEEIASNPPGSAGVGFLSTWIPSVLAAVTADAD